MKRGERTGRVRTTFIKRVAWELLKSYPDRFSPNFEANRKSVGELLPDLSKANRNRIAGYISSLLKQSGVNRHAAGG